MPIPAQISRRHAELLDQLPGRRLGEVSYEEDRGVEAVRPDARLTAEIAERSIAGQIEFWAQLGRAIEPLLEGSRALALRRAGAAIPLSESLASIDSAVGRRRVVEYLESRPFPHYQPIPDSPGLLVRVDGDGTRTVGRFVGREFQVVPRP